MAPVGGGNIKVVVRVRPFNSREIDRAAKCIVQMKDAQTVLCPPEERMRSGKGAKDSGQKTFAFDHSYWSFNRDDAHFAGQDNLHNDLGTPLLDNAFQGYNNCIFAYGQTGSGKSYSMMGYGKEAGVIPNICRDMFERIDNMQQNKNLICRVEVSYLEIYNERVRDLLNPSTKGNLKVREHPSTGPYVEDLAKLVVRSFNEIEHLMDEGNKARTVAATNMNETSSRSHAVFTLTLTQKRHDVEAGLTMEKVAKIGLVDLAGSERATSTGATGARLKEGAEINRSLSALGRVIAALADLSDDKKKKVGKGSQIPYRDSVLTWLLKDSLGGNSMTAMIATISPADINFDETLSTLRYADSAKRIKNHAVVNEDANARMIRELKEELTALRGKLRDGGVPLEEPCAEGTPLEKQIVSIVQSDGTVKQVSKAEIADQLYQSEKLYTDLNQTWEQKLKRTEEIHKQREAALEELGISIEKGIVGLHTPKKMPHLVNLSDDPLLAECLVYSLKPGVTVVGNVETNAAHTTEIRLNGTRILHEHCIFENIDDVVTLVPKEGAAVMVNGKRVLEASRLRSGYRVILGDFHIFRFNNPKEARAERAEQSLLKHSLTAAQLQQNDRAAVSWSPRPGHDRSYSKAISEIDYDGSRSDSPTFPRTREPDGSLAAPRAAHVILGPDQSIAELTDEELNLLFEDVRIARAERANRDGDDDMDSLTSGPTLNNYLSNGTIDSFSLDPAVTMLSTINQREVNEDLREIREGMQLDYNNEQNEGQALSKAAEAATEEVEDPKNGKARKKESIQGVREAMLKQLVTQRKGFEDKPRLLDPAEPKSDDLPVLDDREKIIAHKVAMRWRNGKYDSMIQAILRFTSSLKEAQILSQEMGEHVVFQFTIVDIGNDMCSSYDMALNGVSGGSEDFYLEEARKPCVAVRVIDYKKSVLRFWSLEKLQARVLNMRQMHQYVERPEYCLDSRLGNPFMETCMPQYTHLGDAEVPLNAVFESRVQDFSIDVLSTYTYTTIGIINLSLEPSSAKAPSNTLKFNVVMHDMVGFAEREGTDVHAQLFLPGASADVGITTTQMIKDFDEGPVRFESVHSMSVSMYGVTDIALRVAVYARVSSMHLDKLLSWDNIRDNVSQQSHKRQLPRKAESQLHTDENHDIFARIQILELSESGDYTPVDVIRTSDLDSGTYQLHQGLQRRIVVQLTHNSGGALPWEEATSLRVGHIQLLERTGQMPEIAFPTQEILLRSLSAPVASNNANGTSNFTLFGQWDSSAHNSVLLDRITANNHKLQFSVFWDVTSPTTTSPMKFVARLSSQILPRNQVRSNNFFKSLFQTVRITRSTCIVFKVFIRPSPAKCAGSLSSQDEYVKGEERLTDWAPRGTSLIEDFVAARSRRQRYRDLAVVKPILARFPILSGPSAASTTKPVKDNSKAQLDEVEGMLSEAERNLLIKYVFIWSSLLSATSLDNILTPISIQPPLLPSPPMDPTTAPRRTASKPHTITKSPHLLRSGLLLLPSVDFTRWIRRFVEYRKPYLFLHDVRSREEVGIVGLEGGRVEGGRIVARLLMGLRGHVHHESNKYATINANGSARKADMARAGLEKKALAIYGRDNTWLLVAPTDKAKLEWLSAFHRGGLTVGAEADDELVGEIEDDIDWGG